MPKSSLSYALISDAALEQHHRPSTQGHTLSCLTLRPYPETAPCDGEYSENFSTFIACLLPLNSLYRFIG